MGDRLIEEIKKRMFQRAIAFEKVKLFLPAGLSL